MSPRHKFAHNFFTSSPGIEHLSLLTALCKLLTTTDQLYNLNLCVSVYGCMQIVVTVCDVGLKLSWNDDSVACYSTLEKQKESYRVILNGLSSLWNSLLSQNPACFYP